MGNPHEKNDPLAARKALTKEDMKKIPLIMHQRIGLQNEIAHWAGTDLENLKKHAVFSKVSETFINTLKQKF